MVAAIDRYTYRVFWSDDDGEFVGLCAEFPSLSWLAESAPAAFDGIRGVVREVISDMQANGEPIPEPLATRHYSGVFTVRVPSELHRKLAVEAAEANVSLNRLISARLSTP
ncbi:MAG: type II toxin-antitoxin system HicB family antitoxin [Chloroflexota bacterium]|nr:type II toxin-antitoxin system HicB family antitoxin [Chloroflexota bacterium]